MANQNDNNKKEESKGTPKTEVTKTDPKAETKTDAKGKSTSGEGSEPKEVKPKLNADSFKTWKGNITSRSKDEETEAKPRLVHEPKGKRESEGYFRTRELTFGVMGVLDKQGKEYRTPQSNLDLLTNAVNAKLPKESRIIRSVYVARTFELRFFKADAPRGSFVAAKVDKAVNPQKFLKELGVAV